MSQVHKLALQSYAGEREVQKNSRELIIIRTK
jgi:hypothetical protein